MLEDVRSRPVFVTGATGYIGGRLVPRLLAAGHRVRCLARDAGKLAARSWAADPRAEIVASDAGDAGRLAQAMTSCGAAYYLIHSMVAAGADYRARDRELARTFAAAAGSARLQRIIYLGGLGEVGDGLSPHLSSRREVENALASGPTPVTVLRAAMIIGAGSASFEILRYLVERLPVMITPKWVSTECQPIAVQDALGYLVACLDERETVGRTLDIGGPDILTYRDLMHIMAQSLGLRRRIVIPVPVLSPRLSSLWIHLVTPVGHRIARPLAEGLRNRVVCRNDEASRLLPRRLVTVREAIDAALGKGDKSEIETAWFDAGPIPGDPDWAGGTVYTDRRSTTIAADPQTTFRTVCRLGGKQGWHSARWLWKLRGGIDRMIGGPGLGRGRKHPQRVAYGDVLDFWRVTEVDPDRRLVLRAEMKLPGDADLEFDIRPLAPGAAGSHLTQTARFKPRGFTGILYWFAVKPLHGLIFRGMLEGIRHCAETADPPRSPGWSGPDPV